MEIGCTVYCRKWRLEKEITLNYGDWGTDYCGYCSRKTYERVSKKAYAHPKTYNACFFVS